MRLTNRGSGPIPGVLLTALAIGGAWLHAQQPPAAPPAQPVFTIGVDLVVVEATVLDKSGSAAAGLTPADFHVEIGGKPREVATAVLVKSEPAPAARVYSDVSTNVSDEGARTILLLIDQTSLRAQSRGVLEGTKRWVSTLGKSDRVGLASIPPPGPRVEFTTEHERILEGVGKVSPAPDARSPLLSIRNVSLYEGLAIFNGDTFTRGEVVARECRGDTRICPPDIDMAARDIAMDAQFRVQRVLPALSNLVRGLGALPGPKHVVLISSGWPIDPRSAATEISPIAAEAALSNTTIHSFTAEQWAMSAAVSRPSATQMQDRDVLLSSVEMLSGMTGGQAARLYDDGDQAFKQLSAGLSGYYRLGVRVDPQDLDGKMRRIEVKVNRSGLTLSTYRKVMAAARPKAPAASASAGAASATPDAASAIRAAIEAPALTTDLDLRATSYVLHDEGNSRDAIRVLAVGDVARAAVGPATSLAVLYDLEGRPVANGGQQLDIPASQTARLQASFTIKPGNYRLRFAVRDAEGHIGTVERGVDARWVKAGGAETTGLVLLRVASQADATAEPVFTTVSTSDRVVAQVALGAVAAGSKPEVVIDVMREGASAPLVTRSGRVAKTAAGVLLVQESVPMALLPPGRYSIGATVLPGATTRLTRSFEVEATAPAAPGGEGRSGDLLAFVTLPGFSSATVLDQSVVGPILGRLAERPDSVSVKEELARLGAGPWPTDVAAGPLSASRVAATFVAGLGRLGEGQLDAAANDFRSTLRSAPDFTPAMMFLGACFAAGAKDREAAGAWQTALARERNLPVLNWLAIDAWLRAERPQSALALARNARTKWPDDARFVRQHALAALADGKRAEGLDIVMAMPSPDATLLLASLGTLYEARRDGTPVWDTAKDDAVRQQLRERYAAAGGEAMALVDAWAEN